MKITITDSSASDSYEGFKKIVFKKWNRAMRITILSFLLVGTLFIVYDLVNYNNCSFQLPIKMKTGTLEIESKCYNLHLSLGMGIAFLYFAFYFIVQYSRQKGKADRNVVFYTKTYFSVSNTRIIELSDEKIIISGDGFRSELEWKFAKNFTLIENYVIVYSLELTDALLYFKKELLNEDDYNVLLNFLNQTLTKT